MKSSMKGHIHSTSIFNIYIYTGSCTLQNFANPYSGLYLDSMLKILSKIKTENVKFWRDTHTCL